MKIKARMGYQVYIMVSILLFFTYLIIFEDIVFFHNILPLVLIGFMYFYVLSMLFNSYYYIDENKLVIKIGLHHHTVYFTNIKKVRLGRVFYRNMTSTSSVGIVLTLEKPVFLYKEVVIASKDDEYILRMIHNHCYLEE